MSQPRILTRPCEVRRRLDMLEEDHQDQECPAPQDLVADCLRDKWWRFLIVNLLQDPLVCLLKGRLHQLECLFLVLCLQKI